MQMCVIQDVPVVVLLVFARSILELGIPNFKYSASRSREWMYLFIFYYCVSVLLHAFVCVCSLHLYSRMWRTWEGQAAVGLCFGQQHSVKTLILIENFDADLVSRAQQCGIDVISLRDAEVNKPQIVCSNLCITPVKAISVFASGGICLSCCDPDRGSAVVTGWPALLNACPQSSLTLQLLFIECPSSLTTFFFF